MKGVYYSGPQIAASTASLRAEARCIFRPQHDRRRGHAVLGRVFPGYHFAAGSFAKGEPEPGIQG